MDETMLKSLEKLRNGVYFRPKEPDQEAPYLSKQANDLADEIQAEVDKFYIPRPLFEDGEPANIGDGFIYQDRVETIKDINLLLSDIYVIATDSSMHIPCGHDDRLVRADKDTQEQIDADFELIATEYCAKFQIDARYDPDYIRNDYPEIVVRRHLLERQRKLDGVE